MKKKTSKPNMTMAPKTKMAGGAKMNSKGESGTSFMPKKSNPKKAY